MAGSNAADALLKVKPKTKRGEETLARLCEVAEELFTESNYYSTSVSEIVRRAGISIGAFYIYFNDKISLYKYIVLRYGRRLRKHIATNLAQMEPAGRCEMEREGIRLFLNFCIQNPAIFSIVWQSFLVAPELFINYYDDFGKQYEKGLGEAVRSGEVRPVNLEVASYVLMGAVNFLALKYVVFGPPSGLPPEQIDRIVDELMVVLRSGLLIDKPGAAADN